MNRPALVSWFCLALLPALAAAQTKLPEMPPASSLATTAKEVAADLKEVRELLKKVTDKATLERIELLVTRSELKALELEKTLAATAAVPPPTGIAADNFAKLLKGLKAEKFDDGKVSFIATFAANGRLNCEQARELLKTFSFDDGRTTAAVALYPRLTDPENFFTVLDTFTFDSSRTAVREKLKLKK